MKVLELHGGTIHEARLVREYYIDEPGGDNSWGVHDSHEIQIVSATQAERRALRRVGFRVSDAPPPRARGRSRRRKG